MKKENSLRKDEVVLLRKQGVSLRDIHKRTGIARSTISLWSRDLELTEEEQTKLKQTKALGSFRAKTTLSLQKKLRYDSFVKKGEQLALKYKDDPLFAAGCFLYWGEGSKGESVSFCNTDPDAIYFFIKWINTYFDLSDKFFVGRLVYHTNGIFSEEEIKLFWEHKLKPYSFTWGNISYREGKENKKGKCPYGIFSLRINSVELVSVIFGALRYTAGFNRETWSFKREVA